MKDWEQGQQGKPKMPTCARIMPFHHAIVPLSCVIVPHLQPRVLWRHVLAWREGGVDLKPWNGNVLSCLWFVWFLIRGCGFKVVWSALFENHVHVLGTHKI